VAAETAEMAWIPGGPFTMGSDRHYPEEGPAHRATVAGFFMDVAPATNRMFAWFAAATGYRTDAERAPARIPQAEDGPASNTGFRYVASTPGKTQQEAQRWTR
jgi:formylglycine-generating enzyme required for sulfatase activity